MRSLRAILLVLCSSCCWSLNAAAAATFDIIKQDLVEGRRVVTVRLLARVAQDDLIAIAQQIKDDPQKAGKQISEQTLVAFYLPRMPLDQGVWASVNFAPEAKLRINGLKLGDQETILAEVGADRRTLVGAWMTELPAPPGRLLLFRDKGRTFAEWVMTSGRKTVEELREVRGTRCSRFDPRDGGADYFLMKSSGELELRNKDRLIAVAERVVLRKPETVAAGSIAVPAARIEMSTVQKEVKPAPASPEVTGDTSLGAVVSTEGDGSEAAKTLPVTVGKKRTHRAQQPKPAAERPSNYQFMVFQGAR